MFQYKQRQLQINQSNLFYKVLTIHTVLSTLAPAELIVTGLAGVKRPKALVVSNLLPDNTCCGVSEKYLTLNEQVDPLPSNLANFK